MFLDIQVLMKKIFLFLLLMGWQHACLAEELPLEDTAANAAAIEPESGWRSKASEILLNALSLTGIKYHYGGTQPETGFDCSGFVRYVFREAANITLPPTARAISQIGKAVKKDELQPGDLVFFNTLKSAFSHVGIYIGNNQFIHAPRAGGLVRVENMQADYWTKRYNGAQRLGHEPGALQD